MPFDILSFDIGSAPNTAGVPGAGEHAIAIKPIDRFLAAFDKLLSRTRERAGKTRVAMVGAGAGGVELLLSVEARLRSEVVCAGFDPAGLSFTLISGAADILPTFPARFRDRFRTLLIARRIGIITNAKVVRVENGRLHLEQGATVDADEILWRRMLRQRIGCLKPDCRLTRADSCASTVACASLVMTPFSLPATRSRSNRAICRSQASMPCAPGPCWRRISAALRRDAGLKNSIRKSRHCISCLSAGSMRWVRGTALLSADTGSGGGRIGSTGASWAGSRVCPGNLGPLVLQVESSRQSSK